MIDKSSDFLVHDFKQRYFSGIRLRYGAVAVGLVFLLYSFINRENINPVIPLLTAVIVYNLFAHLLYIYKQQFQIWQIVSLISLFLLLDMAAVTYLIYLTGWLESPYWFLYLVLIIVSGFGIFSRYSSVVFLIAGFCAVFYFTLTLKAYSGDNPIYGTTFSLTPQELVSLIFNRAIFIVTSIFLFASTIFYFSKLLNQNREILSQRNRELLSLLEGIKEIGARKDDFISTASHELRTPLAVIRENLTLVEDGIVGEINPKQKQLLSSSRENIDRIAVILNDLLDISRFELKTIEIYREKTDLIQLVGQALELLANRIEKKGIAIEKILPAQAVVSADPDKILRVFINLLDNAVKYSGQDGRITIGIEIGQGNIRAYVKDSGIGIRPEELPKLFERFTRVNQQEDLAVKGTGLGLFICKGIIELHHGRIWAESAPGAGSTFTFIMPLVVPNE